MAKRKIVHVGQMKSGTTFVQNTLSQNRERLLKAQVLYPGKKINQQHACYGLCGQDIYWVRNAVGWQPLATALIDEVNGYDGDVIISCEALSCMPEPGVQRFVEKLGSVDEVIITVRNLPSTILSAWQQHVKRGGQNSLSNFFERLQTTRESSQGLWRNYSYGNTAKWWSPYGEVRFIVVESFKREELPEIVLQAADVRRDSIAPVDLNAEQQNVSLMWEDVEVLRRINAFANGLAQEEKDAYLRFLLKNLLFPATQLGTGSTILFPEKYLDLARQWAAEETAKIPQSTTVYGDVDLLGSPEFVGSTPIDNPEVDIPERMNDLLYLWFKRFSR